MKTLNLPRYLDEIADSLKPPVSNKIMFNGETLKVMIVGGPNQRDDFHVEEGEELFMQLKGSMELHVMRDNSRKKVPIKESHMFLLPKHVPHSPQRFSNTLGIVFERTRKSAELDTLRWYYPGTDTVLYEEMFHCEDLGTQLKPIIERFFATSDYKKHFVDRPPGSNAIIPEEVVLNTSSIETPSPALVSPFSIVQKLDALKESRGSCNNATDSVVNLFDSEFRCDLILGMPTGEHVYIYTNEVFVWQFAGSSHVSYGDSLNTLELSCGDCSLVPPQASSPSRLTLRLQSPESVVLVVYNTANLTV